MSHVVFSVGVLNAARLLHIDLLSNTLHSPVEFFDVTPVGRLLNRFSKDIDILDLALPETLRGWMYCFMGVCLSNVE